MVSISRGITSRPGIFVQAGNIERRRRTVQKKFQLCVGSAVILCVIIAAVIRNLSFANPYLNSICCFLRPFIYIGLYSAWACSFRKRIIQKNTRRCLIFIAGLMIFWMFVRMCKYQMPYELPLALRYGWYLYYIPMQLIPTASLYLAFYMRQPENYRLPSWTHGLFLAALFLTGLVLTNDLHQLVFSFPEGKLGEAASYEVGVYGYGPAYYLIITWEIGCALAAVCMILFKCRVIRNKKLLWFPFSAYGLAVAYGISYCLNLPFWRLFTRDMTAAFCILFAVMIESCIQCGLIPSNTGYAQLFQASGIAAQIIDTDGKICYRSKASGKIEREAVHLALKNPVMLENGIRLSGAPIRGGYVLWKENLSELQELLQELADRKEELKVANVIEEENLKAKKQMAKLSVKNQLYDKIQRQTSRQIILLTRLIDAYALAENEQQRKKILGKVVVIGAYIKRRSNLIFIAEHNSAISVRELELCLEETIRNLELSGAAAGFFVSKESPPCSLSQMAGKMISSETAIRIYDFCEAVIEETLDSLSALTVSLKQENEKLILSISAECEANLTEAAERYGAEAEQDFDGAWLLSFSGEGGE